MKLAHIHTTPIEPTWHVQLAILLAIVLQFIPNSHFIVGPHYLVLTLEITLLLALSIPANKRNGTLRRTSAVLLLGLITLSNVLSLALVTKALITGTNVHGIDLLTSAVAIYATNIIVFGLIYWELDGTSTQTKNNITDFLFPQMTISPDITKSENWTPTFFDYLYVSITNATAFSPTDTMPLTYRAKLLMSVQSLVSLATIALVAARAINIIR